MAVFSRDTSNLLAGLGAAFQNRLPEFQQQQQQLSEDRRNAALLDNRVLLDHLGNNRFDAAQQLLANRAGDIEQLGGDPSDTVGMLQQLGSGDVAGVLADAQRVDQEAVTRGLLDPLNKEPDVPADQAAFESLISNFSDEEKSRARRIKAGLSPRAGISAAERIAGDEGLTAQVAGSEGAIAGAKEGAKLAKKLAFEPAIKRAVKLAEKEATSRGETLTSLTRAKAALPGLTETVGLLKQLAPIATSTLAEKAFDSIAKQAGFGATEGSTARARFVAIIDNQVLPLLKETFGAAFTVQEGENLKATMGDPDASPAEKVAQLDAFIAQKMRDIETKETELGQAEEQNASDQGSQEGQTATNPTTGQRLIIRNGQWVPL